MAIFTLSDSGHPSSLNVSTVHVSSCPVLFSLSSSFQAGSSPPGYLQMTPGGDSHSQVCVTSHLGPITKNSFDCWL